MSDIWPLGHSLLNPTIEDGLVIPQFVHPIYCWWTFGLFPVCSYSNNVAMNISVCLLGNCMKICLIETAVLQNKPIFSLNAKWFFYSGCISLDSMHESLLVHNLAKNWYFLSFFFWPFEWKCFCFFLKLPRCF